MVVAKASQMCQLKNVEYSSNYVTQWDTIIIKYINIINAWLGKKLSILLVWLNTNLIFIIFPRLFVI